MEQLEEILAVLASLVTIITGIVIFVKWVLKKKREKKIMHSTRDEVLAQQNKGKATPGVPDIRDL